MGRVLFRWTGVALVVLGAALFSLLGLHVGGIEVAPLRAAGVNGVGSYLAATCGAAMIGWGSILIAAAARAELWFPVGFGTGLGFVGLALVRLWASLSADPAFAFFAMLLPGEVVLFLALAIAFLQASMGVWGRLKDAFFSLRAAPGWVQLWVWLFLLPANMGGVVLYGLTHHPLAGWVALGFLFVVLANMALVLYERGISRLTSLPHLIPWVPLQIYTGVWLFAWGGLSPTMTLFAWFYFVVIGISNAFDAYDTWRWFRGERAVLGAPPEVA